MSVIEWKIAGDQKVVEIHKLVVHRFMVADEVLVSAKEKFWSWKQSEVGAWVAEHAIEELNLLKQPNAMYLGFEFAVVAKLTGEDAVFYQLKWGNIE